MDFKPKIMKKRWDASEERKLIQFWSENETFKYRKESNKKNFTIDTPPPYVSGRAHLGFAVHYAQIDMIARYFRMKGFNVIFPACVDRNGLPVEVKVEQDLGKSMHEIDREEFLKICKDELDKAEENAIQVMKWMGLSCNTFYGSPEIFYKTDSNQYRYNTQRTFCKAWYDNLVYETTRPNNWCIDCGTTIADAEIEYRNDQTTLYYIRFCIDGLEDKIEIATTRPELLPACELIVFHPSDTRYSHLEKKYAITPLFGKKIPIESHREVDPDFGSGMMMICAYGDKSDVKILREFEIITPDTVVNGDGTLNKNAGKYQGMTTKEAQEAIINDLKISGHLLKLKQVKRRVPICWRSKTPIEIIAMDEYYLKQLDSIPELRKIIDQMDFFPKRNKKIIEDWLDSLTMDWAISRRRYYGTSIPIWYCPQCNSPNVPKDNELTRYYEAWKENCPIPTCFKCGNSLKNALGEFRTFDTWFDSSISELAVCNFGNIFFKENGNDFFKNNFPCSIRPQGKEIVRTWLYYTILRSFLLFKSPPFKKVWISGLVRDPYGGKMSKSGGNTVDPLIFLQPANLPSNTPDVLKPNRESWKIITEREYSPKFSKGKIPNLFYGADNIRLTSCLQGSHGTDIRFSLSKLDGNSKFITKLWNISRFISSFPIENKPKTLIPTDLWILSSLDALIKRCNDGYADLDFSKPAEEIYNWVWNIFAPHYIELVKSRAYDKNNRKDVHQKSVYYTLHYSLRTILKLLAPIIPFITEYIYQEIYHPYGSIHLESFPDSEKNISEEDKRTFELINLNSFVWKIKREKGLSFKDNIKKLMIPKILVDFIPDLKRMHNIDKISTSTIERMNEIKQEGSFGISFINKRGKTCVRKEKKTKND